MPVMMASRPAHTSQPSQADLDVLALLTSDSASMGSLAHSRRETGDPGAKAKKELPRRDQPMDVLLISAVLAGSGPVTRHHLGHGVARPGAYASCDESRPPSPSRDPIPSKVVMRSLQAPRSERLRIEQENEERQHAPEASAKPGESSTAISPSRGEQTSPASQRSGRAMSTKRRMSIDPAPVSQMLQAASPGTNFFAQSLPTPASASTAQAFQGLRRGSTTRTHSRPQVRCMARTRVPTPHGEIFLHLYHNNVDQKEHLAIVVDPVQLSDDVRKAAPSGRREIRSRTLDQKWRDGETDMERVVRGAYVGRLLPGSEGQSSAPNLESAESIAEEGMEVDGEVKDVLPLVRIHSECFTGETIGSMRCDCGEQLDEAMRLIAQPQPLNTQYTGPPTPAQSRPASPSSLSSSISSVPGRGVVIYMRQEGRGIGLLEKIRAYNLQDLGHDTVTANLMLGHGADERKYDVAAEILRDLGLAGEGGEAIRLLTNNPDKVGGLAKEGVRVAERVGMTPRDWKCRDGHGQREDEKDYADWRGRRAGVGLIGAGKTSGPELEKYLRTKVERMGHMIDLPDTQIP